MAVGDLLVLADKYDMAWMVSKMKQPLTEILLGHAETSHIVSIFAIAYKLRWDDVLKLAARRTLMSDLNRLPCVKEFSLTPETAYHRLGVYHSDWEDTLSRAVEEYEPWSRPNSPLCRLRAESADYASCLWLESYVDQLAAYFKQSRVVPSAAYALNKVTGEDEEETMFKCPKCQHKIEGFRKMQGELLEWFDDQVNIICLLILSEFY